mmetsp:Transcript_22046/g.39072  ORF Transcript_22046/g.39072 Transcript_22046/m.39072 type:complete len:112 (+) Transcript_22046:2-337(+)
MDGLTVGGRALTKHCHRSEGFWPQSKGNNDAKNTAALQALKKILENASWVNVHVVPGGSRKKLPIVEIRGPELYGARWTSDGTQFRGFLEPVSPFLEPVENQDYCKGCIIS